MNGSKSGENWAVGLDAVIPLFDAYRQFYGQDSDIALAKEFLTVRVANNESVIFLAKNAEGKAVGFTQLYPSFSSVSARRIWILNDLFVTEDARGQGIGKALMNAAKQHAGQTFAKGLALSTQKENAGARLYTSPWDTKRMTRFITTS